MAITVEVCVSYRVNGQGVASSRFVELSGVPRIGDRIAIHNMRISDTFTIGRANSEVEEVIWYANPELEAPWLPVSADVFLGCKLLDPDDETEDWHLDAAGNVVYEPNQSEALAAEER